MNRTQPFSKIVNLLILLVFVGCGPAVPEDLPTPIGQVVDDEPVVETAVSTTQATPTAVPTPTLEPVPLIELDSIGDPYAPELGNLGYDVQQYNIALSINPELETIAGGVTITAVATDPIAQLSLDFIGYDINQVRVNGTEATYSRNENKLFVELGARFEPNDRIIIEVEYSGTPISESSQFVQFAPKIGLYFVNNETAYILSEPDGTRYWLPNNDHPRDKAAFRFELTVADGLTAVANGILQETQQNDNNTQTFIWEHEGPMASYLATIAVGEYIRIDDQSPNGVPLRHYIFEDNQAEFARAASITGEAIDWMSDLFGPYPFENFGFVTADATGASLETQTMVVLSTRMIGQVTVIHELAHMWFGNWVSLDSWSEMWRNEGFATYISLMWEHRDDPEGLELEMAAIESAVEENGQPFSLGDPPPASLFSFHTYYGGALMVHELRQTVGDDAFFAGLQLYFERHGGGTASDAEFQAVMEEAYGQSLDAFFEEWLR